MSFFCARRSSTKASSASCALRCSVRSGVRKKFLHQLLGDGAAALDVALGAAQLRIAAADDAEGVEAGMAEEAPVLDGEHRLHQVVGQLLVAARRRRFSRRLVEEVGDQLGLEGERRVGLLGAEPADLLDPVLLEGRPATGSVGRAVAGPRVRRSPSSSPTANSPGGRRGRPASPRTSGRSGS